jgi:hypothetical protein
MYILAYFWEGSVVQVGELHTPMFVLDLLYELGLYKS